MTKNIKKLLNREIPDDYIEESTDILMHEQQQTPISQISVLIFRLEEEWFALDISALNEILGNRPIHCIPHRSEKILAGLVNIRGQLKLCISMQHLLGVLGAKEKSDKNFCGTKNPGRFFVEMAHQNSTWVFPVDEIYNIQYFDINQITNIPDTLAKSDSNLLKGILKVGARNIGYLDVDLIFKEISRRLQ